MQVLIHTEIEVTSIPHFKKIHVLIDVSGFVWELEEFYLLSHSSVNVNLEPKTLIVWKREKCLGNNCFDFLCWYCDLLSRCYRKGCCRGKSLSYGNRHAQNETFHYIMSFHSER